MFVFLESCRLSLIITNKKNGVRLKKAEHTDIKAWRIEP
jgi:hypothetical protein